LKKKYFIAILCLLIGSSLYNTSCKETRIPPTGEIIYSIQGDWVISQYSDRFQILCTFTGTKTEGTVTADFGASGTYIVGGETGTAVKWAISYYDQNGVRCTESYYGNFTDENTMSGTFGVSISGEGSSGGTTGSVQWAGKRQ
jgi:hypothetical protein